MVFFLMICIEAVGFTPHLVEQSVDNRVTPCPLLEALCFSRVFRLFSGGVVAEDRFTPIDALNDKDFEPCPWGLRQSPLCFGRSTLCLGVDKCVLRTT